MTYQPDHDLNHIIHKDPGHRHGCIKSDRPRDEGKPYWIRDGFHEDGRVRFSLYHPRWKKLGGCGHSWSQTDPACKNCPWGKL